METTLDSFSLCVIFGSCPLTGLSFPSCKMRVPESGILFWLFLCLSAWRSKKAPTHINSPPPPEADQLAAGQLTLQNYIVSQSGKYYQFRQ